MQLELFDSWPEQPADRIIDQMVRHSNLLKAFQRVKRNGGAPGVDGMTRLLHSTRGLVHCTPICVLAPRLAGEPETGNLYLRFDEGLGVVQPSRLGHPRLLYWFHFVSASG